MPRDLGFFLCLPLKHHLCRCPINELVLSICPLSQLSRHRLTSREPPLGPKDSLLGTFLYFHLGHKFLYPFPPYFYFFCLFIVFIF